MDLQPHYFNSQLQPTGSGRLENCVENDSEVSSKEKTHGIGCVVLWGGWKEGGDGAPYLPFLPLADFMKKSRRGKH